MAACKRRRLGTTLALALSLLSAGHYIPVLASFNPSEDQGAARSRATLSHDLPRMDAAHLRVSMVEVVYGPGGSSPAHSHPCPLVGHVVEGALRMQVKGEPEAIYRAGESFYEAPNGVHLVSANESDKETAKFIAVFVCDHDTPLSVGAPEPAPAGGR